MPRKSIKFEYDKTVDAAYVHLNRGKILKSKQVQPGVIFDFDARGEIVGVEILRFKKRFSAKPKARHFPTTRSHSLKKSA
jgi:uncharacterized protein YuzE